MSANTFCNRRLYAVLANKKQKEGRRNVVVLG